MTKEQTRAAAQIMLAWAEGKKVIEFRDRSRSDCSTNWHSTLPSDEIMAWNWESYDYRLNSEPREFWINSTSGKVIRAESIKNPQPPNHWILAREVLE